MENKLDSHSN